MIRPAADPDRQSVGADRPDLRMVPLAAACWAGTWLGTGGAHGLQLLAVTFAVVVAAGTAFGVTRRTRGVRSTCGPRLRRPWGPSAVALLLLAAVAVGGAAEHRLTTGPVSELAAARAVATVDLTIRSDPQVHPPAGSRPAFLTLRAVADRVEGRGAAWRIRAPVLVTVSGDEVHRWSRVLVGTRVVVQGRLQRPDPGSEVAAVVRIRGPMRVTAPPPPTLQLVERVRAGLRQSVAGRSDEPRALVPALVLGDTSAMTAEITEDFRTTGLVHLTAVSGANLTLLLAFLLLMARWLGVRGRWLRVVGLLAVVVFVALCRTEPSVLRAAAMGLVALAALGAGGARSGLRTLSVAMVALLLVDPYLSRSIGFALSVLASGGIVWWASRWASILHAWLPRLVAESVAVPLAAHLATLPVVAAISEQVSVVGVLANAIAGPLVGPATVLGFAAAGLSLVSSTAATVAGFGAAWSAQGIVWIAHAGARFPGASWHWPVTPTSLLVLGVGSVVAGGLMPMLLSRRWLSVLLAMALVAGVRSPLQPGWPPPAWVLVVCDVGQGDGLVLRVADGQAMVVDVGPDPVSMRRCLDDLGVRYVPVLMLTHFHSDHVDGLPAVFDGRKVGEVWVSPWASPPAAADRVRAEASRRAASVRAPAPGEAGQVGEVSWRVLGPVGEHRSSVEDGESAAENDASLVVMVTVRGVRILLTGDVEPPGQEAIVASGADLRADVLKLPHHGSGNQDPGFLAASGARVAIASAGTDNDYGHPAPRTIRLVQSLGMTLMRTDEDGSVAVASDAGQLSVTAQRRR
ncbi:MAG TPA: ComEC/Rec2 family competence protein [Propionibacteriaceae bacterium]|nr:ComEC/Rec2 family competence protein [Propionibacteriaceae bacterium]